MGEAGNDRTVKLTVNQGGMGALLLDGVDISAYVGGLRIDVKAGDSALVALDLTGHFTCAHLTGRIKTDAATMPDELARIVYRELRERFEATLPSTQAQPEPALL